jgi:AraC family transcriptional regulator
MTLAEAQTVAARATALDVRSGPKFPANLIDDERQWRFRPRRSGTVSSALSVAATRWRSLECRTREVGADTPADCHVVAIVLRNQNVRFSVSGRMLHDGPATPGMVHVTEPAAAARCVFRGPYDVLHLYVPNRLIAVICGDISRHESVTLSSQTPLTRDSMIEALARALLAAERIGGSYGRLYADSVSIAIVARLLSLARRADASERPRVAESLPNGD